MSPQAELVLRRLKAGERLTSLNAVVVYGIQDLPKRVSDLRACGIKVKSRRVDGKNRYGNRTHWNEYWL